MGIIVKRLPPLALVGIGVVLLAAIVDTAVYVGIRAISIAIQALADYGLALT